MTTTDRIGEAADKMAAKGDALSRSTKQTAAELEDEGPSRLRDAAGTVKTGVDSVMSGASQVAERLPDLAGEARSGAASTAQTFEAMSDPTLQVVAAASLGFGTALFLTGAPRLITFVALAPAIFAAGTMIGRQQRRTEDR